jgi:RES domain-containing protein
MIVFRIVQDKTRARDLSGTGASKYGGRWNSKGTFVLYTSETSSLAYLESLVHFNKSMMPPELYLLKMEINDAAPIFILPGKDYPRDWRSPGLLENQQLGDKLMKNEKYLAIKIKSAINVFEYNYLLNPFYLNYRDLVKVVSVSPFKTDGRLVQAVFRRKT